LNFVQTSTRTIYFNDLWVKKMFRHLGFPIVLGSVFKTLRHQNNKITFQNGDIETYQNKACQRLTSASQPARETAVPMQTWYTLRRAIAHGNCCTFAPYILTSR